MTEYIVQDTSLTAVANKIREKTGGSAPLEFPDNFIDNIDLLTVFNIPDMPTDSILFYSITPFTIGVFNKTKNWNGSLYYSNDHESWIEWDGTNNITAVIKDHLYLIYLKGEGVTHLNTQAAGENGRFYFFGSGIKCIGNFNTILDYNTDTLTDNYCCFYLFAKNGNIDFDIILPFENLGEYAYDHMFYGCTSLTKAPVLPATSVRDCCYGDMFNGCSILRTPPALPALTMAQYCYNGMFMDCYSLDTAPALPADTLALGCYKQMFAGCSALVEAPALPASTMANACYHSMFYGCTSLLDVPKLKSIALEPTCYTNMFTECVSLRSLPELPATTLKNQCYYGMFYKCSNIKISTTQVDEYQTEYRIPLIGTASGGSATVTQMFTNTGGTFTGTPSINTTYYTSNTVISAS